MLSKLYDVQNYVLFSFLHFFANFLLIFDVFVLR